MTSRQMIRRPAAGFTLIELLLTMALLLLTLAVLGALFAGSLSAHRTEQTRSQLHQDGQAASQLLQYELSLAGYRGTESAAAVEANTFESAAWLDVSVASSSVAADQLTLRYYEDRYTAAATSLRTVVYTLDQQNSVLHRQESSTAAAGTTYEAVASGVRNLKVHSLVRQNGAVTDCLAVACNVTYSRTTEDANPVVALTVRLTLVDNSTQDISVALSGPTSQGLPEL